jgi:hypothetical protein
MDETEKLRRIVEECVTRQLRGFNPGHDRRDVAYEVAHCVLSRMRSASIKVVTESPPWPQVDR